MISIQDDPEIIVFWSEELTAPEDDFEVDVEVEDDAGRWGATFVTLKRLDRMLRESATTGDFGIGIYAWTRGMVVVREVSADLIRAAVADLIARDALHMVFEDLDAPG